MTTTSRAVCLNRIGMLQSAQTFEEYRDAHAHYIGMLIEKMRAENAGYSAVMKYVAHVTVDPGDDDPQSVT